MIRPGAAKEAGRVIEVPEDCSPPPCSARTSAWGRYLQPLAAARGGTTRMRQSGAESPLGTHQEDKSSTVDTEAPTATDDVPGEKGRSEQGGDGGGLCSDPAGTQN